MFKKIVRHYIYCKYPKILKRDLRNQPDFTKNRYKVSRGAYNYLNEEHVKYFQSLLGEERVVRDLSDLEKYNVDWFKQVRGSSTVVLKPKSTEEVSKILSFCNNQKLAVCTQGGNTGVVGACVPVFDEIIVSTELMNEIIKVDENSGTIICEAGCILQNIDNVIAEKGLTVPLDLGSKGTCQIGGNVSTNAGGMRLIKYGNMHGNVLGLEAVKANGEIINCLNTLKKDNTGYHLKHLFIGSEGTLGLVTKVALQCVSKPKYRNVAFLGLQNWEKVLQTFKFMRHSLAEILSAVEVLDSETMEFSKVKNQKSSPIGDYPYYLMIETSGSNEQHDEEKLNHFFSDALEKALVLNGTVANDTRKIEEIWSIRDNITNGYKRCEALMYDLSLPLQHYFTIVDETRQAFGGECVSIFGYGHIGDGNLHLTVEIKEFDEDLKEKIDKFVLERTLFYNGSISAEHGLGFLKSKYLKQIKSENSYNLMTDLKRVMDPNGILNPYKVFPIIN